jgi:hypothetical protein
MAVVLFGPLSVPFHFIRTRRSWAGADMALVGLGVAVGLNKLPVVGVAWLFGIAD